ncbi:MAG: GH3 auxin-responsive promoter family protein, partial [Myxococcota bacterium]
DVLSLGRVLALEPTGGSSGTAKWIPFTRPFVSEIARATSAWLADLHTSRPELRGTRSYWAISPAVRRERVTSGGVRLGLDSDADYFGAFARWAIEHLWAVPQNVATSPTIDVWRERTCLALLAASDLGLISVWSPSFLTLLLREIESHLGEYLARLPAARARDIQQALAAAGAFSVRALWPRLALVSSWTSGSATLLVPALERYLAGVPLQPKGLIATEGIVSFPLDGEQGAVLAVGSHFLEFLDLEGNGRDVRRAHELREGAHYSPILTASNGLVRYHLKDVVRCVGHTAATPRVVFEGRLDRTS